MSGSVIGKQLSERKRTMKTHLVPKSLFTVINRNKRKEKNLQIYKLHLAKA